MAFRTADATPPEPVDTTVYKYGNECGDDQDLTLCGEDFYHCHMSWPADDSAEENSENAACRSLPMQRASHGYTYSAQASDDSTAGLCGDFCDSCHYSWPSDATAESAEGMFRCKPEEQTEQISFGPSCINLYDMECGADCHDCRESWPTNDPRKWYSDDMLCRCKAEEIREVIFGDACDSLDSGLCGTHCRECNMSWEDGLFGSSNECRCKRSW